MGMKSYWAGMATLPLAIVGASAAVAAAVGAHRLAYSWAEKRITTLGEVQAPMSLGTGEFTDLVTLPKFGGRQAFAGLMLTAKHAKVGVLGPNTAVIFLQGKPGDPSLGRLLNDALEKALKDLVLAEARAKEPDPDFDPATPHNFL